jgi:hypothetical protein
MSQKRLDTSGRAEDESRDYSYKQRALHQSSNPTTTYQRNEDGGTLVMKSLITLDNVAGSQTHPVVPVGTTDYNCHLCEKKSETRVGITAHFRTKHPGNGTWTEYGVITD